MSLKIATNFLELSTNLKTLGAKWLPEKDVNFTHCNSLKTPKCHTSICIYSSRSHLLRDFATVFILNTGVANSITTHVLALPQVELALHGEGSPKKCPSDKAGCKESGIVLNSYNGKLFRNF